MLRGIVLLHLQRLRDAARAIVPRQPAARHAGRLANFPDERRSAPANFTRRAIDASTTVPSVLARGDDPVIKQAPSVGRILTMVAFTLSCFGIVLFLWISFGGSVPLRAKGYQVHVAFPEATQLAQSAEVRISGREGRPRPAGGAERADRADATR